MASSSQVRWAAGVALCAVLSVIYMRYAEQGTSLLLSVQFQVLRAAFATASGVLLVYLAWSWIGALREARKHAQRVKTLGHTADLLRHARQQLQEEAARKARAAEEEAEELRRAEAARVAEAARAFSASLQPGGGEVHHSDAALAAVRARQQSAALCVQAAFKHQQEAAAAAAEREARERSAAAGAAARATSAARQPGGGAVHVSHGSSSSVGQKPARPSTRATEGTIPGAGGAPQASQGRAWDGPVFPGDELRGWVSPAAEEAARLRAHQDAELERSLRKDRAKEEARLAKRKAEEEAQERARKQREERQERRAVLLALLPPEPPPDAPGRTTIAVRLPDSSVQKRSWNSNNTVQDLYNWVECMKMLTPRKFQLVRPFPREVFPREGCAEASFDNCHLCPQALVVVELVDDDA